MVKEFTRHIFPRLAMLLLVTCSVACGQDYNNVAGKDTDREVPAGSSVTSGIGTTQLSPLYGSSTIPEIKDSTEINPDEEFPFRLFVTPEDQTIEALAAQISGPGDAYQMAVQWIYISEEKLNHATDKWLTPHEFLANTPNYPSNPLQGKEVSDCEEQAHALVSLIRAEGIRPEEVRVVLGEVTFNNVKMGHAWVELLMNGKWVALDPSWGPYWDDRAEKLIQRRGISFDYYASHNYPMLQVWAYYNDIYCLDLRASSGNALASWREAVLDN